jgi:hypothetical protein
MGTQPRSPAEHYAEAERALAAAESPGAGGEPQTAALLLALAHAVMATVPRRALRSRHQHPTYTGGSPSERWLHGEEGDR